MTKHHTVMEYMGRGGKVVMRQVRYFMAPFETVTDKLSNRKQKTICEMMFLSLGYNVI
jgi:hypothetical protein